jgi:ParB family chromosome partitioning protein
MLGKGLESLITKKKQQLQQGSEDFSSPQTNQPPINDKDEGLDENFLSPKPAQASPVNSTKLSYGASGHKERKFSSPQEAIFQIETEKIKPNPHQPRRDFDENSLKELAASIHEFGILQPIIVSKIEKDIETGTEVEYQLIAGERRLMAAKLLGWERVPAIIKNFSRKSEQLEMAVIENLQRADLSPIETARAYAKLQDEFGLTQREIAQRLGKSRETIANSLRLLNLPSEIQDALAQNRINESQARLLLVIEDLNQQQNLFKQLLENNLSVRELRQRIKKTDGKQLATDGQNTKTVDPEIVGLEEKLTELLGAQVNINPPADSEKGGKIIITFYSPEEIRGIIKKLSPNSENQPV